ncbi:outer membrane beta-barrel protein [Telmatospirillum siberiense]|uniref:Porin n=1 Tax=Telmatospirillum siberiense TaxID=382514 RepID=A0A2N3PN19_9PROT|nr:outer membrane beta-barrel protein [Telmatospirillum siberiense]PKU21784.1 porin [Telmatospirillum siberiense]
MKRTLFAGVAAIALSGASFPAWAEETPAAAPDAGPTALSQPAMTGPIAANPNPFSFDAGPAGTIYVSGILSGFGQIQTNHASGDHHNQTDITNGQAIVQKTDGLFQFYVQAGTYSLPSLGTPYMRSSKTVDNFYGAVPVAYAKVAPNDSLSIQAGKLTTLIGGEYTFSVENMNINRGLLWNQENAVTRGVQGNYTVGPLAFSLQWTDGFYSDQLKWLTGSATYTIDPANSVAFVGGGNFDESGVQSTATPLAQNNSQIYNVLYTYNADPITIAPYIQYSYVPKNVSLGITHDGSTIGGALLAKYSFGSETPLNGVSLPIRFEYISSSGSASDGTPNLLYGAGSDAWSITFTPTYQYKLFFARAEAAYVGTIDATSGSAFGGTGTKKSQARLTLETGIVF